MPAKKPYSPFIRSFKTIIDFNQVVKIATRSRYSFASSQMRYAFQKINIALIAAGTSSPPTTSKKPTNQNNSHHQTSKPSKTSTSASTTAFSFAATAPTFTERLTQWRSHASSPLSISSVYRRGTPPTWQFSRRARPRLGITGGRGRLARILNL